ncbi:hypothetical protein [Hyphomicrobium sp. NDB2Meth4]|uniref:hypothetical protein n=1 Tax=Hyphomicrobium sp. NDB2Meth4 TaxID=1892846 RepID=UPI0009307C0B|nr:hypothetical protein [Hyphomicrobium sp. NDB2Meth4]
MVQTSSSSSVQFTPAQVLQAARRAEAEGKMDYALQFYRHLVEQHGGTPEAQEAREGLFRIAEWRWGEARVARSKEAGGAAATGPQPPQTPPSATTGQRVYNVANNEQAGYASEEQRPAAGNLPQIISRQHAPADQRVPFEARFGVGKAFAHMLSGAGWLMLLSGIFAAAAGFAGLVGELSALGLFGAPFGVMLGLPAVLFGLVFVVGGQLAAALFESANATLEATAIQRARAAA